MGFTITIHDNIKYCRENNLEKKIEYECQCNDFPEMTECHICNGEKVVSYCEHPFELNMSMGNFPTLWSALGLKFDYCGEINPHSIKHILSSFDEDLLLRSDKVEYVNEKPMFYNMGISLEQAQNYIKRLLEICNEAIKREENIVWY